MMKNLYLLLLLLFIVSHYHTQATTVQDDDDDESYLENEPEVELTNPNITHLTQSNFTSFIQSNVAVLTVFYAPWCGHCVRFAPTFSALADYYAEKSPHIKLAAVNSPSNEQLSTTENIHGYPTIKLYFNNSVYIYEGDRIKDKIIAFINKKINGAFTTFTSVNDINNFYQDKQLLVISTIQNDNNLNIYERVAKANDLIDFVHCISIECVEYYKHEIVFLRKFDEELVAYTGEIAYNALDKFIETYCVELAGMINEFTADLIFDRSKVVLMYFRSSDNETQCAMDKMLKDIAKEYRDVMYFMTSDIKGSSLYENVRDFFYLQEKDLPQIQIVNITNDEKFDFYIMEYDDITKENVIKFVNDFFNMKLIKEPRSESLPEESEHEMYLTLVGRNFKDLVIRNDKHVMVLFLGRGCGDVCGLVKDLWGVLAEKYRDSEDVTYAVMDLTLNEVRGIQIEKYPTIAVYTKHNKQQPQIYNGDYRIIHIEGWMAEKVGWVDDTRTSDL